MEIPSIRQYVYVVSVGIFLRQCNKLPRIVQTTSQTNVLDSLYSISVTEFTINIILNQDIYIKQSPSNRKWILVRCLQQCYLASYTSNSVAKELKFDKQYCFNKCVTNSVNHLDTTHCMCGYSFEFHYDYVAETILNIQFWIRIQCY